MSPTVQQASILAAAFVVGVVLIARRGERVTWQICVQAVALALALLLPVLVTMLAG